MKNIIRIILVVLLAAIVFVQSRPDHFRVERSGSVPASPEVVYAHIANFHDWAAWSPWEKIDPNMQRTFDGPESGVGAGYAWVGNDKVGSGSMKITSATPNSNIVIALEFLKPFKASNVTTFDIVPEGEGAKVTWIMEGKNNFVSKAMCMFMNMDKMVGGDFERGLANLKTVAAAAPATPAAADSSAPAAPTGMSVK